MAISTKIQTNPVVKATIQNNTASKTVGLQDSVKTQDSFTIDAAKIPVSLDNSTATNVRDALNDTTTSSAAQTLTNKTIDADNNTISNLEVDNFKGTAIVTETEGLGSSDNDTSLPTTAAVKDYVDTQVTAQDLDFQADTGGALSIDLDSESLLVSGGTGINTSGSGNTITIAVDDTIATKTYVDNSVQGEDTLLELNDTDITSPVDGAILVYNNASSKWVDANGIDGGLFNS
jgi:hypothetical protein